MLHAPITLLYGSLIALLIGGLGAYVSKLRADKNLYIGGTPDEQLLRAVRAHGNAAEYAPLLVILLLALEVSGAGSVALHVLGGGIVVARLAHATGVLTKSPLSAVGAVLNYVLCFGVGIYGLILHFR